jgi:hypothetical protein
MATEMALAMFWLFAVVSGRGLPNDLTSLIDADEYFKARQIAVTLDRLLELAGKKPGDGRDQVGQLLAIRYLGEHAELAKDPRVQKLLEEVADGKKGAYAEGFARDYARRALDRLAGRPPAREASGDQGNLNDAFTWLPERVSLVGAYDLRKLPPPLPKDELMVRAALGIAVPAKAREEMFKFIESTGNLRIDRFVWGFFEDRQDPLKMQFFARFTGLGDPKRLVDVIRQSGLPIGEVKEEKGPRGEPITLLLPNNNFGVGIAVTGNTDLFFATYPGQGKSADLIREVMKVRSGGQPSVLKAPLGNKIKEIPRAACLLVVGDLPQEMRKGIQRDLSVAGLPEGVVGYVTKGRGVTLRIEGTSDTADNAKLFAGAVGALKDRAIAALQNLPAEIQIKPDSLRQLIKEVENAKIEVKDRTVSVTLTFSVTVQNILQRAVSDSLKKLAATPQGGGR